MTPTILFGATVNGELRTVQIESNHPELATWAAGWTDGVTQFGEPDADDLAAIEQLVMNNDYLYEVFYDGASQADRDAELLDITAEVI